MESPIHFSNEQKEVLRGIFHSPDNRGSVEPKSLFIFPNGGIMGCEGDYRAHVSIARHLVRAGYYVLRFSPSSFGYSNGNIPDCRIKNLYAQIETGLLVEDIKAAVKYSKTLACFSSITLSGICGGAISSFLAAAELEEVKYVIPIGIPVILDNDNLDYTTRLPADKGKLILNMYIDKLFSPEAWLRLLARKSDLPKIKSAIISIFSRKDSYIANSNDEMKFNANFKFYEAAERIFKDKKKVFFVFGDNDGFWWEFQRLFLDKYFKGVHELPFDLYLASRANHMLSMPEMQKDVANAIVKWKMKHIKSEAQ